MRVKITLLILITILSYSFGLSINCNDSIKIITDAKYIDDSTILVVDTLKKTDTMVVYFENENKPSFEISFSVNPIIGLSNYYSNSNTYSMIANQLNNEISKKVSYKICLNLQLNYYHFLLTSGIQYLNYNENISHKPKNFIIDAFPYQKLDTISTWGQIIDDDTTYIMETEWNTYYNYDTTYINNKYLNKFNYLEIPFEIGRRIYINQFNIDITAGFINQLYFSNKKDILLLDTDKNLYQINIKKVRKYNFSYSINFNINYKFSNSLYFLYGLNYNRSAISIFYKDFDYSQKHSNIGIKIGIVYKL